MTTFNQGEKSDFNKTWKAHFSWSLLILNNSPSKVSMRENPRPLASAARGQTNWATPLRQPLALLIKRKTYNVKLR